MNSWNNGPQPSEYSIKNVKIHTRFFGVLTIPKALESQSKKHSNFTVIRFSHLVFIVFPTNSCVNICGIPNFEGIKYAVSTFETQFQVSIRPEHVFIDNSTASGRLTKTSLHLFKLQESPVVVDHNLTISIRPHYFPSAVIRGLGSKSGPRSRRKCRSDFATCIVFSNGKFIIVGGVSLQHIAKSYQSLCAITQQL